MEFMESPLNRAHQCSRKADRMVAQGKYEQAILCHGEAADLLKDALLTTQCEQAHLSLELQRGRHLQQQWLIQESWRRAKRAGNPWVIPLKQAAPLPQTAPLQPEPLLPLAPAPRPPLGSRAAKDDRTRLEERSTAIADLRKLVAFLLAENERLSEENERLRVENARLRRDPYTDVQSPHFTQLSPLDMPARGLSLAGLPPDLQEEIQQLWERE